MGESVLPKMACCPELQRRRDVVRIPDGDQHDVNVVRSHVHLEELPSSKSARFTDRRIDEKCRYVREEQGVDLIPRPAAEDGLAG